MIPEFYVFYGILIFTWIKFLLEQYLTLRQRRVYKTTDKIPERLTSVLDVETFNKAKSYGIDKNTFSIVKEWLRMIFSTGFICLNGYTSLWNFSKYCLIDTIFYEWEILISYIFVECIETLMILTDLPMTAYSTFIIEEKHGLNKENLNSFAKGKIKKFLWRQLIILLIIPTAITFFKLLKNYFSIWLFLCLEVNFIVEECPEFITQFSNRFTPLSDGVLKTKIEKLAKRVKFPLCKIYTAKGSKPQAHSNAHIYGFFNKKNIVLYDILSKDSNDNMNNKVLNDEEILAIIGHELGHWKLNHILFNLIISQINTFFMFILFTWLYDHSMLYREFGFDESTHPVIISLLIIFHHVFFLFDFVISFARNTLNRQWEFQADAFVKKHLRAKPLKSGLIRLHNDNLGFPVYDSLFSTLQHTYPRQLERLTALSNK